MGTIALLALLLVAVSAIAVGAHGLASRHIRGVVDRDGRPADPRGASRPHA